MEEAKSDPSFEWSVESVLRVINATVGQVRWSDQLRHFPDLRHALQAPMPSLSFAAFMPDPCSDTGCDLPLTIAAVRNWCGFTRAMAP